MKEVEEHIEIVCSISTDCHGSECKDSYLYPKKLWDGLDAESKRELLELFLDDHVGSNSDRYVVAQDKNGNVLFD